MSILNKKIKQNKKELVATSISWMTACLLFVIFFGASFWYIPIHELIDWMKILFSCAMSILIVILYFLLYDWKTWQHLSFRDQIIRSVILLFCAVAACFMPLLPVEAWFFTALYLLAVLFLGVIDTFVLLMPMMLLATFYANAPHAYVLMLSIVCSITALLFRKIDKAFHISIPVIVSLVLHGLALLYYVLQSVPIANTISVWILPGLSIFIHTLLYIIILRLYSTILLHRHRERYVLLNDQEYVLLQELKSKHSKQYYDTIHLVHFCDVISTRIPVNHELLRAGAYYYYLSMLCEQQHKNMEECMNEHRFPDELADLQQDLARGINHCVTREAAILLFCHHLLMAIMKEKQSVVLGDEGAKPEYRKTILRQYSMMLGTGALRQSPLAYQEIYIMRTIFIEEELYYDFIHGL